MCARFSLQPAELNGNDCITGHFTSLKMVFRSLLYIPYQLCICQVVPFFSVSCQNCFQVVFAIQVMWSQFWLVYNVNVCFCMLPHLHVFWFWRKNKIRVTFQIYSCPFFFFLTPWWKRVFIPSGNFSATTMQISWFPSINLQVHCPSWATGHYLQHPWNLFAFPTEVGICSTIDNEILRGFFIYMYIYS